jgi:hypothetical protein
MSTPWTLQTALFFGKTGIHDRFSQDRQASSGGQLADEPTDLTGLYTAECANEIILLK